MNDNYFIHLFETPLEKYFYDVNMNKILNIPETVYKYLRNEDLNDADITIGEKYIEKLKVNGYLKKKRVECTKNPQTKYAQYFTDTKINYLVLQVTQNCNLRCEYCVYSGGHNNRAHNESKMNIEIAKKGIDFLVKHSSDCNYLYLGFYGGEPLLEFELIKQCVEYTTIATEGKKVDYSITTNGTLINDEVIDFFYKNNFIVTISLDGPSHIHNLSRHFAYSDKGSFDKIMENLKKIKKKYPDYYKKNVKFNAVLTTQNGVLEIEQFFKNNCLTKDNLITCSIDGGIYTQAEKKMGEDYIIEEGYLQFLTLLSKIGWLENYKISGAMESVFESLVNFKRKMVKDTREELPDEWHHGGPCMPSEKRLFMTVDGGFYPCEKVSETRVENKIGDLFSGIDIKRVTSMLNVECINQDVCKNCWAYSLCSICVLYVDNVDKKNSLHNKTRCSLVRSDLEEKMKTLCILKELNYDLEHEIIQI
ncbi:Cys-rich peptide radical SAM maturase CcpM [Anaerophilus nitritogenes]|uniref:Cys-rich peptide radical SAM maturase CcpM n=1 Tax=Anaerophilus nitritogenes TaxID=2498136 RepID=UPI00101CAE1C|nr:Cys-rich peptide radical SAM maturase CcpM [Anaerophilus nitritogenes]